ncbi:MAG: HEAT repeat domain-containing protein, partial [bacterium]
ITAARALGELGVQEAVNPLIDELADYNPAVRMAAADALGRIGHRNAASVLARIAAEDPSPEVRKTASRALQELSDRSVKSILHSLSPANPGEVNQALNRLIELGDAAIPPLIELLNSENQFVRAISAEVLGTLGNPVAIDHIARLLFDPEVNLRIIAVRALGKIRHIRATEKLIRSLEDPDSKVAGLTANQLELLGELAVEPVFTLLTHPSAEVRARAIDVLGRLRYQGACEILSRGLTNKNILIRIVSAQALGEIGEVSYAPALVAALDDQNHIVRAMAAEALGKIRDYRASIKLLEMANDPSDLVRSNAFRALGRIGNPAAIPLLIKAIDDIEPSVRIAAIEALAELRATDGIEKLRQIARVWPWSRAPKEVKEAARWAIEILIHLAPKS